MRKSLPLAILCGVLVAVGIHGALLPDWPVAVGTGAVYAGVAYLYVAFGVSLLGHGNRFDDRTDRVGYAIGLFGVSVTPLLFANHYASTGSESLALVVAFLGVIAFLEGSARAHRAS